MSVPAKFPPAPILCWVTDRRRTRGRKLVDIAQEVVDGGFNMIRIREPDLGEDALEALIDQLKDITRGKAILISNWRSSDNLWKHSNVGLHFPEAISPDEFTSHSNEPDYITGRSVHSIEAASAANYDRVNYLTYGTVFPSKTHPGGPTQGLKNLSSTIASSVHPILAIGGINPSNLSDVMATGVYGVSVIGSISEADKPLEASKLMTDIANSNSIAGAQWI